MKFSYVVLMMLFTTFSILGCGKNSEADTKEVSSENLPAAELNADTKQKAPDFKIKTIDGKDLKLSDYKGKIVVIDFWATWCGPCRRGIPDLVSLQNEYKGKLVVVGVSLDKFSGTDGDVKGFMKDYKINYPVAWGTEQVIKDYGNVQSIPTSFVIDQKGNVVDMHVGLVPKEAYVQQIKALLGKS